MSNIEIFNEDFFEKANSLPDKHFDLIFLDPPYFVSGKNKITYKTGKIINKNYGEWDVPKSFRDKTRFAYKTIKICKRLLKDSGCIWICGIKSIIFIYGYLLEKENFKIINDIAWFKRNQPPTVLKKLFHFSHETLIYAKINNKEKYYFDYEITKTFNNSFNYKSSHQLKSVWDISQRPKERFHPNQKPQKLLEWILLSTSPENANVLDPFMGIGTTGIVCAKLNRNFVGFEKDKKYFDIAEKLINSELKKSELF